jgi:hypothetical protein
LFIPQDAAFLSPKLKASWTDPEKRKLQQQQLIAVLNENEQMIARVKLRIN